MINEIDDVAAIDALEKAVNEREAIDENATKEKIAILIKILQKPEFLFAYNKVIGQPRDLFTTEEKSHYYNEKWNRFLSLFTPDSLNSPDTQSLKNLITEVRLEINMMQTFIRLEKMIKEREEHKDYLFAKAGRQVYDDAKNLVLRVFSHPSDKKLTYLRLLTDSLKSAADTLQTGQSEDLCRIIPTLDAYGSPFMFKHNKLIASLASLMGIAMLFTGFHLLCSLAPSTQNQASQAVLGVFLYVLGGCQAAMGITFGFSFYSPPPPMLMSQLSYSLFHLKDAASDAKELPAKNIQDHGDTKSQLTMTPI